MLPIVQIATYVPGSAGNTIVFTLPKTPTPGNILVAFTGYSQYGGARTITGPGGFVKIRIRPRAMILWQPGGIPSPAAMGLPGPLISLGAMNGVPG